MIKRSSAKHVSDCRLGSSVEARRIRTHAEGCVRIGSLRPATQLRRTAARRQIVVHSVFGRITPYIGITSNGSGKATSIKTFSWAPQPLAATQNALEVGANLIQRSD